MTRQRTSSPDTTFLGIEGGGTRTVALWLDDATGRQQRREFGPANLRLLSDPRLVRHLREVARHFPRPAAVAIGLAGARNEKDRERIRRAAGRAWPGVPCHATNDLETALMAGATKQAVSVPSVLILSGTGSCCFGRSPSGRTAKIGGWGHLLGDKGSAYEIGLRALKAVVYYYDRDGRWPRLGARLLAALQLNEPDDLMAWVQQADKSEVAALAVEVFQAWSRQDRIARDILTGACQGLVKDALLCAERLVSSRAPVEFILAGGVLLKQKRFASQVETELRRRRSGCSVVRLRQEGAAGAVALARQLTGGESVASLPRPAVQEKKESKLPSTDLARALTEQRNPRSEHLDRMPLRDAIRLMLREEALVPRALLGETERLAQGITMIARALGRGGRLFYVGAGTSGRLGVLDASECPPTFQTPPHQIQGIIAGGRTALWQAVEGAEDDSGAGARAVGFRDVDRKDVVVGIAASGRTPFVWGALAESRKRGAKTMLLTFNPQSVIPSGARPHLIIAPRVGPEVLTGSTRLKAGTATKLVLNLFTTLAMVRLGKVLGNLMIDVKASNDKLRDRAARIVQNLTGENYQESWAALVRAKWDIRKACRGRRA